ncbi:MAG: hypothetical protein HYZ37_00515 [Candidatus Solibacter usitatus]|nr:hypothetical protein [Candidatus Solibacter usitatus]
MRLFLLLSLSAAFLHAQQRSTPLTVSVGAACDVKAGAGAPQVTRSDAGLSVSGTLPFVFRMRTGSASGSGVLRFRLMSPAAQGTFDFQTSLPGGGAQVGTNVPAASEVTAANFGAGFHTARDGNRGEIRWEYRTQNADAVVPAVTLTVDCQ